MKKESQCQIRSHHKCLNMLQLQIISFDNVIVLLHYDLIILIWRSHACCKATGKWNWKGHATAQCPLETLTVGLAPSDKTAHPSSACPSKLTAICCGLANLCGNTRYSTELQSSKWRYTNYETGKDKKTRRVTQSCSTQSCPASSTAEFKGATSREVGNNCWKTTYGLEKRDC